MCGEPVTWKAQYLLRRAFISNNNNNARAELALTIRHNDDDDGSSELLQFICFDLLF